MRCESPEYESPELYTQARAIMQCDGRILQDGQGGIVNWSWNEDAVRRVFGEQEAFRWFVRTVELEHQGYASLCLYAGPYEYESWRDWPLEELGTIDITSAGILALATLYGRD